MYLRLKEILKEKGITSKWLANEIGMSETQMSKIITGASQPRFETLGQIARILDINFKDLFKNIGYRKETKDQIIDQIQDNLDKLRQLGFDILD